MKYLSIIILLMGVFTLSINAQDRVGIGTNDPQGVLHINPEGITTGINSSTADDVIVTTTGDVGIGTQNPATKLDVSGNAIITGNATASRYITTLDSMKYAPSTDTDPQMSQFDIVAPQIRTGFRLRNGDETGGANYIPILATDIPSGRTTWEDLPELIKEGTDIKIGAISKLSNILTGSASTYYDITQTPITLTTGTWLICAKATISTNTDAGGTNGYMAFMYLGEDGVAKNNIAVTGVIPETAGFRIGIFQITHLMTVTGTKTLRVYLRSDYASSAAYHVTGGYWTDPYFFAIRLDHTN